MRGGTREGLGGRAKGGSRRCGNGAAKGNSSQRRGSPGLRDYERVRLGDRVSGARLEKSELGEELSVWVRRGLTWGH